MAMDMKLTLDILRTMLAANIPVKLESLPGAGKTSHINALFEASNGYLDTMVAVTRDPTDFGGIPVPGKALDDLFYDLRPERRWQHLTDAVSTHSLVGLHLDELNTASRAVLAAALKVVDERRIGDYILPQQVRIIMSVNPAEANGGVDLTPAMANRTAHLPFEYPLARWVENMRSGVWDVPDPLVVPSEDELRVATQGYASMVADYAVSGMVGEFESYPQDMAERSNAWPSRRTWTMGARAMGASDVMGMRPTVRDKCLESLVGKKAADGFMDYRESLLAIDPQAVLADPMTYPLPTKDDELFITVDRVAGFAVDAGTAAAVDAACKVMCRIAAEGRPGVAAGGARQLAAHVKHNRNLVSEDTRKLVSTFADVIRALGGMEGSNA